MTIAYIKWRDATIEEASEPNSPLHADPLITLEEIGWLAQETVDAITLVMEWDADGPGRNRLSIPRVCILEMRVLEFDKFPQRKRRI